MLSRRGLHNSNVEVKNPRQQDMYAGGEVADGQIVRGTLKFVSFR